MKIKIENIKFKVYSQSPWDVFSPYPEYEHSSQTIIGGDNPSDCKYYFDNKYCSCDGNVYLDNVIIPDLKKYIAEKITIKTDAVEWKGNINNVCHTFTKDNENGIKVATQEINVFEGNCELDEKNIECLIYDRTRYCSIYGEPFTFTVVIKEDGTKISWVDYEKTLSKDLIRKFKNKIDIFF